ncbi:rhodanese-like domain-containing protein [Seonamhaeicola marinus]|uniref:Rhodanese-like domain-containing protein n=1 Tax=Seonamhaeicola marinus TaxID=1912246 RepID=A0A5D0HUI7_9FLAO|nr:rhodanese-like domain-containing protein [Seonamhaeicola marinus]TYA74988.1 rhodanese-like domain-containing protein [Seonamhaeicola marinus]
MSILGFLFKKKKKLTEEFLRRNAIIIDVRTAEEYVNGAIIGSRNFPLQSLGNYINEIKAFNKPIITCCASGVRSGIASKLLRRHNIEVINGGSWHNLNAKL